MLGGSSSVRVPGRTLVLAILALAAVAATGAVASGGSVGHDRDCGVQEVVGLNCLTVTVAEPYGGDCYEFWWFTNCYVHLDGAVIAENWTIPYDVEIRDELGIDGDAVASGVGWSRNQVLPTRTWNTGGTHSFGAESGECYDVEYEIWATFTSGLGLPEPRTVNAAGVGSFCAP